MVPGVISSLPIANNYRQDDRKDRKADASQQSEFSAFSTSS
jgi:hypothetical protein